MTPWVALTRSLAVSGRHIGKAVARNTARRKLRSELLDLEKERRTHVDSTLAELEALRFDLRRRYSK